MVSTMQERKAHEILDSRGEPALEVTCTTDREQTIEAEPGARAAFAGRRASS